MSADGFVADANGGNDWIFKTGDSESQAWSVALGASAGLIIMGRKSFEMMAPYWPTASGPFAEPMNRIPKAVFSKSGYKGTDPENKIDPEQSPAAASWASARIFDGDLATTINQLKAEPGDAPIVALGGATFMRNLIAAGLIDEFHLAIHPVILGSGMPIFTGVTSPMYLKLAEVKTFPNGTCVHTYYPA